VSEAGVKLPPGRRPPRSRYLRNGDYVAVRVIRLGRLERLLPGEALPRLNRRRLIRLWRRGFVELDGSPAALHKVATFYEKNGTTREAMRADLEAALGAEASFEQGLAKEEAEIADRAAEALAEPELEETSDDLAAELAREEAELAGR